jgi:hypothetical protein
MQTAASPHDNIVRYVASVMRPGEPGRPIEFLVVTELCSGALRWSSFLFEFIWG